MILNNSWPSCFRSRLASMPPCPTTSCNHVMLISYVNIHQANPSRTPEEKLRGRVLDLALGSKNGPRNGQWICIVCTAPSAISQPAINIGRTAATSTRPIPRITRPTPKSTKPAPRGWWVDGWVGGMVGGWLGGWDGGWMWMVDGIWMGRWVVGGAWMGGWGGAQTEAGNRRLG